MNQPLVSICSITYNHAPYIRECLDGFLMQKTDFPFEIIIHDDCSNDGTTEIIREYAEKYPDIIVPLYESENQYSKGVRGMFATYCFPKARGKYIALCEGDDYWTDPLKLQKQVDFLEKNPEYGLVYTDFTGFNERAKRIIDMGIMELNGNQYETVLCEIHNIWTLTVCFRAEFLKDVPVLDPSKYFIGDRLLFMHITSRSLVHCLYTKTAVYRILGDSASHFSDYRRSCKFRTLCYRTNNYYLINGPEVTRKTYKTVKRNIAKALIAEAYYCNEPSLLHEVEFPLSLVSSVKGLFFYFLKFGKNLPFMHKGIERFLNRK